MIKNNMIRAGALSALLGVSMLLPGCASIINGNSQIVSVETRYKDQAITGATCQINNGKGTYYVTTPGSVTVNRAYDNIIVRCEKTPLQPGINTVESSTKAMAFGNILFGGFVGAAVDASTGAAYDYPNLITVMMGEIIQDVADAAGIASPSVMPGATAAVPGIR